MNYLRLNEAAAAAAATKAANTVLPKRKLNVRAENRIPTKRRRNSSVGGGRSISRSSGCGGGDGHGGGRRRIQVAVHSRQNTFSPPRRA